MSVHAALNINLPESTREECDWDIMEGSRRETGEFEEEGKVLTEHLPVKATHQHMP
jgi:hypothetical protein